MVSHGLRRTDREAGKVTGFVKSVDHHQNSFEKCKNCSGVGLQVSKFNVIDFFKNASS